MKEMSSILVLAVWTSLFLDPPVQEPGSRIEQYLKSQAHQNGFSGDVLIAKGDELLITKSFRASSNLTTEVSQPQDRFPVGSIAEQFIAAAILQLELTGQVRLDSSICDYISDCPDSWKPIHILHLLTHSSGLPSLQEGSPCVQRGQGLTGQSVDVKERHYTERHILRNEGVAARDIAGRNRQIRVREGDALGPAGAAAGV